MDNLPIINLKKLENYFRENNFNTMERYEHIYLMVREYEKYNNSPHSDLKINIIFILDDDDKELKYIHINKSDKTLQIIQYIPPLNDESISSIQEIIYNKRKKCYEGIVILSNVFCTRENLKTQGVDVSNINPGNIIKNLHAIAYFFDIEILYLSDIARKICPEGDKKFRISLSRKLAGLSYYYEQFGYRILEEHLLQYRILENFFSIIRSMYVKDFLDTESSDMTLGEYFRKFNNRNPDINCQNAAYLLSVIFGNDKGYFDEKLINQLYSFLSSENFYYVTSITDLYH